MYSQTRNQPENQVQPMGRCTRNDELYSRRLQMPDMIKYLNPSESNFIKYFNQRCPDLMKSFSRKLAEMIKYLRRKHGPSDQVLDDPGRAPAAVLGRPRDK